MEKVQPTERDFILARLAVARTLASSVVEAIDACTDYFYDPTDDKDGKERETIFEVILEDNGVLSRAVECAQAVFEKQEDREEGEPDYDEIIDATDVEDDAE